MLRLEQTFIEITGHNPWLGYHGFYSCHQLPNLRAILEMRFTVDKGVPHFNSISVCNLSVYVVSTKADQIHF
jgi:hypothetical protein